MNPEPTHSSWLMPFAGQRNMFTYLPGEVIVHMCRFMDTYTLLKFGRCSSRLYNMVCSPEVWRRLLRGIEDYSEAKIRMLMLFARKGDFLNLMTEVLREIASRNTFSKGEDRVRLKVTIGGWREGKSYHLRADALKRLYMVEWESALVVAGGARMIVNEVQEFDGSRHGETYMFSELSNHVKIQQSEIDYFEVRKFDGSWANLHILRKCKAWLIHELHTIKKNNKTINQREPGLTVDIVQRHWRYLASSAHGGNIKILQVERRMPDTQSIYAGILESVRKVWEISDNVQIILEDRTRLLMRAGRNNGKQEENWQELMAALQL